MVMFTATLLAALYPNAISSTTNPRFVPASQSKPAQPGPLR